MNRFLLTEIICENVILTDDVMRVEMLCAHHMDNARLASETRGLRSYAGTYKGTPIAVIACGFGKTAAMLHLKEAYELGARRFIYLGECVSLTRHYPLMDIVVAKGYSETLTQNLKAAADLKNTVLRFEGVYTDDCFWIKGDIPGGYDIVDFAHSGFSEMAGKKSAEFVSLLVVSENSITKEKVDESVRQSGFHTASQLAFETLHTIK